MRPSSQASSSEQEYPYGWRFVKRVGADGAEALEQVALTLEDVLHPQEGDVIPESKPHEADRRYLANVCEARLPSQFCLVTSDLLVLWGIEGLRGHSPDVGVFTDLRREPDPKMTSLDLADYDGRCALVVELVSPSTRDNDVVKKKDHYHTARVQLYVIVDQFDEGGPRYLRAYRRKPDWYDDVKLDDQGRVAVPLLGLSIGLRDDRVVCFDLKTQQELGDYAAVVRGLEQEKQAREAALRQRDEAVEARAQLEEELGEQVVARQDAERQAREARADADRSQKDAVKQRLEAAKQSQEAENQRKEAENQRLEAENQRKEAERAQKEADKHRAALEELERQKLAIEEQAAKQIRELLAKVALLQGANPPTA